MRVTCFIVILLASPAAAEISLRSFFDAVREVETGGHAEPRNAKGDGGRSLGPYQISKAYWQDSGVPGHYRQVRNRAYAEKVMIAYWERYCSAALERRDLRTLARIHNGGPNGTKMRSTKPYWKRVRNALHRKEKG
jgi:hypothetical protein